jgi:cytochrome c-type biogenesis protein CcmH/NrfF
MSERTPVTVNRVMLALSLAFVLTLAAIIALFTGSFWVLPLAAAVHAFGTMVVLTLAVRVTRAIEHPSPTLAAAMNEEGVVSADHRFSEMVEEFKSPEADELDGWANVRSVRPQDDPATAGVQQSRSTTPTSQPSEPAPDAHIVDLFIIAMGAFFSMVSVIIPLATPGRWLWLTPAIVVPICAALVAANTLTRRRKEMSGFWVSRAGIVTVAGAAVLAAALFCVLVALFVGQPSGAQ